ncbi:hypothetical protein BD779DRAFT_1464657 [Infundibulicybe gibba]|nr:hypothetical protein BD779DRAFT_1464657 [Infundibulicybe gibba]
MSENAAGHGGLGYLMKKRNSSSMRLFRALKKIRGIVWLPGTVGSQRKLMKSRRRDRSRKITVCFKARHGTIGSRIVGGSKQISKQRHFAIAQSSMCCFEAEIDLAMALSRLDFVGFLFYSKIPKKTGGESGDISQGNSDSQGMIVTHTAETVGGQL